MLENSGFNSDEHYGTTNVVGFPQTNAPGPCVEFGSPCPANIIWENPWKVYLPGASFFSLASQPNWCALQPQK